jgi:DNA-binding NarL/FixJ family response regulator
MNDNLQTSQSILIIDDHVLFREGLTSLFQSTPDFHVEGEAGTVKIGVEKAFHFKPDIILMDFSLPDGTGLDAARIILKEHPDCKIIFLTVYETTDKLLEAINLGAKGYLLKNVSSSSLLASLRSLAAGEIAMSRKMMSLALESSQSKPVNRKVELFNKLSQREREILFELEKGISNLEIANNLFISENTVKHHIHSILEKLNVKNRQQAADIARQVDGRKNKPIVQGNKSN